MAVAKPGSNAANIAWRNRVRIEDEFWANTKELKAIRQWAWARNAAPWAVLGEVLAEVICHIPPTVKLPPIIGGHGTLNLLIASVGSSGAGKGAASGAARASVRYRAPMDRQRMPVGSGEGIPHAFGYVHQDPKTKLYELVRTQESVLIEITEIDTLEAIGKRQGSTLSPTLRQLYSGEQLGFGYVDVRKKIIIPGHSYRSCVIAGAQPGRGAVILNDVDGGFPQRWLWLPATDKFAPDKTPDEPEKPLVWKVPDDIKSAYYPDEREYVIPVCGEAEREIIAKHKPVLRGEAEGIESHRLYTQLKVAAGLAFLSGGTSVELWDWQLAASVMRVSDGVRSSVEKTLREKALQADHARGRSAAIQSVAAAETVERLKTEKKSKIAKRVIGFLSGGDWIPGGTLRNKFASEERALAAEVLDELVAKGKVESKEVTYHNRKGVKYRVRARA